MTWKVNFFRTSRGQFPVKDFIEKQDKPTRARVNLSIRLLVNNGPYLKDPYMKKLQNNLYELRIRGKIAIRIFYSKDKNEYYLLHAFKKKTQKTPIRELQVALGRMKEIE